MELRIELLGPLRVRVGGNTAVFRTDALRVLLATLATHQGQPQRRDTLAGLLSPDRPNKEALTYLRNRLTRLRQAVGDEAASPPWFEIDRKQITLRVGDDIFIDMTHFEALLTAVETHPHRQLAGCPTCLAQLAEAVKLVRGEFLAGLNFPSETWEAWLLAQREHVQQRALAGLAWLREAEMARSNWSAVVELAQRELAQEPWLEAAHRALMQAHFALGDRNAALAQYAQCQQVLVDELGVEPEPETVALREAIEQNKLLTVSHQPAVGNLPVQVGRFIGREREQTELLRRLADPHYRLVTLVGTGGMGKTRLAVEVAARAQQNFPDGVWFVSLAGVGGGAEQVQTAVGEALGLGDGEKQPTAEQVSAFLRDKQLLLILDNCEGVLAAPDALGFIPDWLRRAPHIALLATSREPLNFQAESVVGLAGLPVGNGENTAVSLFAERAQMARDDFALTDETLPQVRHICHLVDGSPLGIALAAAWVRRRSLAQIGAGIAQSLDFLTTRLRDVDQRHRSMRAVFEASWQLLEPTEQAVLAALALFPSSFALSAAEAIAGATLFDLDTLCEKSLLQQAQAAERYSLHSLVRQFAAEKLGGQRAAISQKFVAYFYQFAQAQRDNYEALQPEWRNLDTAVSKAHELADWATLLGLVAALDEPWMRQIRFAEMRAGLRLAVDAAEQVGDMPTVAHYLLRLGQVDIEQSLYEAAEAHLNDALTHFMQLEDSSGIAHTRYFLSRIKLEQAADDEAMALSEASKQLFDEEGDGLGVAKNLSLLALCHIKKYRDFAQAQAMLQESVLLQKQAPPTADYIETLRHLARVHSMMETYGEAERCLAEAVRVSQAQGNLGEYTAVLYEQLLLAKRQNQLEAALRFGYECLENLYKLGSLRWEGLVKTQLGLLHQAQGAEAQAVALLTESVKIFAELGDDYEEAYSHYYLYKLHGEMGEAEASRRAQAAARRLNEGLQDPQLAERLGGDRLDCHACL